MKISDLINEVDFENNYHEFKKRIDSKGNKRWVKTICGFANSNGGNIYIGVNDDKTLSPLTEKEVDVTKQTINNNITSKITPLPNYDIKTLKIDNGFIIVLNVSKNTNGITFFKDSEVGIQIFVRRDGQTEFALPEEISLLAQSIRPYEYDKSITGIKKSDVTFTKLNDEYQKVTNGENITDKLLLSLGLINKDRKLTVAGLLFSDYESLTNSNVSFTVWPENDKGDQLIIDNKKYSGNIIEVLYKTIENIENVHYYVFGGRKTDVRTIEVGSFNKLSLREALVNAIAHRDYTIDGNEIAVDCYKNRIEITSPGSMLQGQVIGFQRIDLETPSLRRNSVICNVLEKLKLMDNKGSGFSRIVADYQDLGDLYAPLYKTTSIAFTIQLKNKKYFISSNNTTTPLATSKYYLENVNLFKSQDDFINENPNNGIVIDMIKNDKTTNYDSIASTLDITKDGAKYYITKLRDAGIVRREGTPRYGHYEVLNDFDRPSHFNNLDDETKLVSISWCKKTFKNSNKVLDSKTSYSLKHAMEKDNGIYLTNGQFKGAMLLSGFTPENISELNWKFKVAFK